MSGLFHRNKRGAENENIQWQENPAAEPEWEENPLYQKEKEQEQETSRAPLLGLYSELHESKKGGLFKKNSDYYNVVSASLVHVLSILTHTIGSEFEQIQEAHTQVSEGYIQLIRACKQYLGRRSFTDKGKSRQDVVRRILEQAESDKLALDTYFGQCLTLPESERAKDVGEALQLARRKKLVMKKADSEYKHVGGAASRLTVLEQGDLQDSEESGFFKEQDIFTFSKNKKHAVLGIMEKVQKSMPIEESLYQKVRDYVTEEIEQKAESSIKDVIIRLWEMPGVTENFELYDFIDRVGKIADSWGTVDYHMLKGNVNIKLKDGESINMSNRNVATSRVADILGVGDIIAKSETVEMVESGQKKGRVGNLMQKAKGREAAKIVEEMQHKEYQRQCASGKTKKDNFEDSNLLSQKISGNFQKQLASLQVLDYLTGQVDRHTNNYLVQEDAETGMLTGLTGIDNDFSFGNAMMFEESNGNAMGKYGRSVVNSEGKLIIPHMDEGLAKRILALDGKMLSFLLADVLEPNAIQHACERLETLKRAIEEEMSKQNSKVFINDEDWNEDTLNDFANSRGFKKMGHEQIGDATYLGKLINFQKGAAIKKEGSDAENIRNVKIFWSRALEDGKMDTPEKIMNFLYAFTRYDIESDVSPEVKVSYKRGLFKPGMSYDELPEKIRQLFWVRYMGNVKAREAVEALGQ